LLPREVVRGISHNERQRMNGLDGVHGQAIFGPPGNTLANVSDRVDVTIIGSRSYEPLGRLVHGSTLDHLGCTAPCPLLISRARPRLTNRRRVAQTRTDLKTAGVRS
jgi:hypothetical protein